MSVTEFLGGVAIVVLGAAFFGVVMGAAVRSPVRRKAHAREIEKFRAGQRRTDPDVATIGPHRPVMHNARYLGVGALAFGMTGLVMTALFG